MYKTVEKGELQYGLVMKDDLSPYSSSLRNTTADSEAAVDGLSKWTAAVKKTVCIKQDRKSHFTV